MMLSSGAIRAAGQLIEDDFPMFGKITGESFQTLEKQILKSF